MLTGATASPPSVRPALDPSGSGGSRAAGAPGTSASKPFTSRF